MRKGTSKAKVAEQLGSRRVRNLNNAPYHVVTRLVHDLLTLETGTFVVLNVGFLDLVSVAAFGFSLGQLFARRWGMRMEWCLGSVMKGAEGA